MLFREKKITLNKVAYCGPNTRPAALMRRLAGAFLHGSAHLFVQTARVSVGGRRREVRNVTRRPHFARFVREDVRVPSVNLRVESVVVDLRQRMVSVKETRELLRDLISD